MGSSAFPSSANTKSMGGNRPWHQWTGSCVMARAAQECHILPAVAFVSNRRRHASPPGLHFVQLLALVGAIGHEAPVVTHMENQVAACGNGSPSNAAIAIRAPDQSLLRRIPSLQAAANVVGGRWTDGRRLDLTRYRARAHIAVGPFFVFVVGLICVTRVGGGDVHQPRIRIERHRRPVVGAAAGGIHCHRFPIIVSFRIHRRTLAIIEALGPVHFHKWCP